MVPGVWVFKGVRRGGFSGSSRGSRIREANIEKLLKENAWPSDNDCCTVLRGATNPRRIQFNLLFFFSKISIGHHLFLVPQESGNSGPLRKFNRFSQVLPNLPPSIVHWSLLQCKPWLLVGCEHTANRKGELTSLEASIWPRAVYIGKKVNSS